MSDKEKRILALVPNDLNEGQLAQIRSAICSTFLDLGISVIVTDSMKWYREKFAASGNWDSWVWDTVLGRDYSTRSRYFDGFVVVSQKLGRVSANIAILALRNDIFVLSWSEDKLFLITKFIPKADSWVYQTADH